MYAKAIAATTDEERVELFKEAQKILNEESASVYIQDIASFLVYNKNFEGNVRYPLYAKDYTAIYKVAE